MYPEPVVQRLVPSTSTVACAMLQSPHMPVNCFHVLVGCLPFSQLKALLSYLHQLFSNEDLCSQLFLPVCRTRNLQAHQKLLTPTRQVSHHSTAPVTTLTLVVRCLSLRPEKHLQGVFCHTYMNFCPWRRGHSCSPSFGFSDRCLQSKPPWERCGV